MTESEIISEVKAIFAEENSVGSVDTLTIKGAIRTALKNIAGPTSEIAQEIVEVQRYSTKLPLNFKSILEAQYIDLKGYNVIDGRFIPNNKQVKDFCNYQKRNSLKKIILFNYLGTVEYYFDRNTPLHITNTPIYRSERVQEFTHNSASNVISVNKYNIETQFEKGFILITYNRFPTNSKGELYVPDTKRNDLKNYVLNSALAATAKWIMIRERDNFMANLYQMYQDQEDYYKNRAEYEAGLTALKDKNFKQINRAINRIENAK